MRKMITLVYLGLLKIDKDMAKTMAGLKRAPGCLEGLRRKIHFRGISVAE